MSVASTTSFVDQRPEGANVPQVSVPLAAGTRKITAAQRRAPEVARVAEKLAGKEVLIPKVFHGTEELSYNDPKSERPWMRQAAMLVAANYDKKQVAEVCGVSYAAVKALCCAPWFQEVVVQLIEQRAGGKNLIEQFKAAAAKSHLVLMEVLDNPKAKTETRVSVALSYLDRAYGKAKQTVEVDATVRSADPVAEMRQLEDEIARLAESAVIPGLTPAAVIGEAETDRAEPSEPTNSFSDEADPQPTREACRSLNDL